MQSVSQTNFGPLIAYLVPGATALLGASEFSPTLRDWFVAGQTSSPTIGGFLYLTLAAFGVGMTVSAARWALIDTLHHKMGISLPPLNFSKLSSNVDAYSLLIRIHYEHYMFYANMTVALLFAYVCYRVNLNNQLSLGWIDVGFIVLEPLFFLTSRDTLTKYYSRSKKLFAGTRQSN